MKKIIHLIFLIVCLAIITSCNRDTVPIPDELIEFELASTHVDDTYLIRIHLPEDYETVNKDYPVLYQLDGNTTTGSVIEDYDHLISQQLIRECIIVSIDYKFENERVRDFTPTAHKEYKRSGGAEAYLQFLQNELIPKINAEYRTDLVFGNTLRGHSLGGLFTTFAMLQVSEDDAAFTNFITESPSWWWDDNYIIGLENSYAESEENLPFRTYFSVGELEHVLMKGGFEVMRDRLLSRNYIGFQSTFEMLSNQAHLDVRENENGLINIFGI